jgi:hypothetical protein
MNRGVRRSGHHGGDRHQPDLGDYRTRSGSVSAAAPMAKEVFKNVQVLKAEGQYPTDRFARPSQRR